MYSAPRRGSSRLLRDMKSPIPPFVSVCYHTVWCMPSCSRPAPAPRVQKKAPTRLVPYRDSKLFLSLLPSGCGSRLGTPGVLLPPLSHLIFILYKTVFLLGSFFLLLLRPSLDPPIYHCSSHSRFRFKRRRHAREQTSARARERERSVGEHVSAQRINLLFGRSAEVGGGFTFWFFFFFSPFFLGLR